MGCLNLNRGHRWADTRIRMDPGQDSLITFSRSCYLAEEMPAVMTLTDTPEPRMSAPHSGSTWPAVRPHAVCLSTSSHVSWVFFLGFLKTYKHLQSRGKLEDLLTNHQSIFPSRFSVCHEMKERKEVWESGHGRT